MTVYSLKTENGDVVQDEQVRLALERILRSADFLASERMSSFLRYVVSETLSGRGDQLKQYKIARNVFNRSRDFTPETDPVVRVQAAKVRRALERYYLTEGKDDAVRLTIPKGTYVPTVARSDDRFEQASGSQTRIARPRTTPRVAVLPFVNQSTDSAYDTLADGFSEDLATELSRFSGISVVAYYSTKQYVNGNSDPRAVAGEIDADYLLTGSVRCEHDGLRIRAQLNCSASENQVWAERFDRELTACNVFEVCDRIAALILARVADDFGIIALQEAEASSTKHITDLTVYDAILRWRHSENRVGKESFERSLRDLERAVEIDPECGQASALLSIVYLDSLAFGFGQIENAFEKGIVAAQRAVALDPRCADSHFAVAFACLLQRDIKGLTNAAETLINLNPNAAYMVGVGGWFLALSGQYEVGLEVIERSFELNPHYPSWLHFVPFLIHYERGDYAAALIQARKFGMSGFFWNELIAAATLGQLGRQEEAHAALNELLRLNPDFRKRARFYTGCFVLSDSLLERLMEGLAAAGFEPDADSADSAPQIA